MLDMDAEQILSDLTDRAAQLAGSRQQLVTRQTKLQQEKQALEDYLERSPQVSATLDHLTSELLGYLSETIEEKLTLALQQVLEQPIQLKIERDVKRGRMTLDFSIQRQGKTEDIMRGQGGSVANILSVGLRLFALTTLANIQQQAKDNYGTDDLKELEQQLENMKQSNQTMINDYEKHIESIRTNLDKVKQEFSQANLSNSDA